MPEGIETEKVQKIDGLLSNSDVSSVSKTEQISQQNGSEAKSDGGLYDVNSVAVNSKQFSSVEPVPDVGSVKNAQLEDVGNKYMSALQAGDRDAMAKLMRLYNQRLYSFIYRIIRDAVTVEDIIQETWIRVYQHRLDYRLDYKFSTYLFTIARRKALSEIRKRNVRSIMRSLSPRDSANETQEDMSVEQKTFVAPDAFADGKLSVPIIEKALAFLPEHQREIVMLRDVEGFENEEIAEILGWNILQGTIRKRVHDAREAFKKALIKFGYVE